LREDQGLTQWPPRPCHENRRESVRRGTWEAEPPQRGARPRRGPPARGDPPDCRGRAAPVRRRAQRLPGFAPARCDKNWWPRRTARWRTILRAATWTAIDRRAGTLPAPCLPRGCGRGRSETPDSPAEFASGERFPRSGTLRLAGLLPRPPDP